MNNYIYINHSIWSLISYLILTMFNLNHQQSYGIVKWLFRTYQRNNLSLSQLAK